jgi:hypothetical protein
LVFKPAGAGFAFYCHGIPAALDGASRLAIAQVNSVTGVDAGIGPMVMWTV